MDMRVLIAAAALAVSAPALADNAAFPTPEAPQNAANKIGETFSEIAAFFDQYLAK